MRVLSLLLPCMLLAGVPACMPPAAVVPVLVKGDIAAPPPGEGHQLIIGPFDVPPGSEVQKNFFVKLPAEQDVMVKRIQIAYPTGSHHCNLFKSDKVFDDHVEDSFDAVPYEIFDMFAAAQTGDMDWSLPAGVGIKLKGKQQLIVQTHWVNAATQKTPDSQGKVKINFWYAKPGEATTNLGMLFAINKNLDIAPRATSEEIKTIDLARQGFNQDVSILAMTGHFHSRGKKFEVSRLNADASKGEQLYFSDNWDEPPFKRFDTPLPLKAGERMLYTSTFVNDTDMVIKFGPKVETQEHSNLFMYFTPGPADGKALYDVGGLP